ncbi:MAG: demethoxyubiquinone hydroxylase family protein [Acetobacteraceae bacterium]
MRLPGDPSPRQAEARMIRVDHAGEYGAVRIYQGQRAVLGGGPAGPVLAHMQAQEEAHLARFRALIAERRVRPTALLGLWHLAGFALGAATAALGTRAAMACTVAVEAEISAHYARQEAALAATDPALAAEIAGFRADEEAHHDTALAEGAAEAPGYRALTALIRAGCRVAIAASEIL